MSDPTRRRLRLAYVYDALYPAMQGGAERRFHELGTRLSDQHEVHFVSWQYWDGAAHVSRDGVQYHGVGPPPELYGGDGKRTVAEAARFAAHLGPELLRGAYDVIDCSATPYVPLYACALAARTKRARMVATWHEFWGDHWAEYLPHRPRVARIARRLEASALGLGDRRVAVSSFTADRMIEARPRRGKRADRIQVVGNGIVVDEFKRPPSAGVTSDVIFVGRLIEDKRVDLLLEAIAILRPSLPRLRCLVVGEGPERKALEAQASVLHLRDHVSFLGHVDEAVKVSILKASSIGVLPSIREGFGIAAIEAQAAGLVPIVARSPHSAAPSLIHDGVDGLVCDPTPEALAEAIRSLLTDPFRLALMRAAAVESASRWDWDRVALAMERIYLEVAHPEESADARYRRLSWG